MGSFFIIFLFVQVKAYEKGYTGGDHIYFAIDYFKTKSYFKTPEWKLNDDLDEIAKQAFRSLFLIRQSIPNTQAFHRFEKRVEEMAVRDYNESVETGEVNTHAIGFYDSIIAFGEILNEILRAGENMFDGARVAQKFRNRAFYGLRGRMVLNEDSDLNGNYEIWTWNYPSATWKKAFDFAEDAKIVAQVAGIDWVLGHPPPSKPFCGFTGNNPACAPSKYQTAYYAIGSFGALMGIAALTTCGILKSFQRRHEQRHLRWWEIHSFELSQPRWMESRANSAASNESNIKDVNDDSGYTTVNTALFHGYRVYLITNVNLVMTHEAELELKKIRQIKCEKLVRIIGVCLSDDLRCLVFEYCPRGDIHDLVHNVETYTFILDWNLRFSLIRDIVKGLMFIHNSWINCHGKLRSTKCLMDQRFVVKITDYALRDLRPVLKEENTAFKSLWVAPELLHLKGNLRTVPVERIRRGDIYSLGMIFSEVIWLRDPQRPIDHENLEKVVEFLGNIPDQILPKYGFPRGCSRLVAQCMLRDALCRPDISTVYKKLKTVAGCQSAGAADSLIARMAAYAAELEETVVQRTNGLKEEQHRIEEILFEIFPRTIALSLVAGVVIDPEEFESVTVLFSCVEDFGDLVCKSSPFDVVNILNELYYLIDTALTKFDIYKVETIADIYMVVSGLPIRNGNRHVAEISYFATHLLKLIQNFYLSSMPTLSLRLKIGFHSGKCMAGVIGHKMPRYCLFGDTVNTASRMETTSEGGRIQISATSADFLDKHEDRANFVLTSRGEVVVKGKGAMKTYWLTIASEFNQAAIMDRRVILSQLISSGRSASIYSS